MPLKDTLRYELPREGTSLLGYIVRRMHKTSLLLPVEQLLKVGNAEQALACVARYTVASATSYGRAYYQPEFNRLGDESRAADPETGWSVWAKLTALSPHYVISYRVEGSNGAIFSGTEEITGTTVGLHGLGMPAPSRFEFTLPAHEYNARLTGILTSELALSLFGQTRIRAYGFLSAEDSLGNTARLDCSRDGKVRLKLNNKAEELSSLL
jgi:hypothetical protein